jgi:RNA polymerase sigma factor (sigma-70 family)
MSAHASKTAEDLIREHSGWIAQQAYSLARQYHVDQEDLMQQGRLGIVRAMESYDDAYGVKFLTYAKHWIHRRMQEWIWKDANAIRVPPQKFGKVRFFQESLHSFHDYEDDAFERCIAVEETIRATAGEKDIRRVLESAIAKLPPHQAKIIQDLYFDGFTELQAGHRHGIGRAAVNLRKNTALKKLREMKLIQEELAK